MDSFFDGADPKERAHSDDELEHFMQPATVTAVGDKALRGFDDLVAIEQGEPLPSEQPKEAAKEPEAGEAQVVEADQEPAAEVIVEVAATPEEVKDCPIIPLERGIVIVKPVEVPLPNAQH